MRTCQVEGCGRKHVALGYCAGHRRRYLKTGDPGPAELRRWVRGGRCSVDGCELPHSGLGLCDGHRQRFSREGDAGGPDLTGHWTGDAATYIAVHIRLRKTRGRASKQACAHCRAAADEWAYDHAALDERVDERGRPYTTDLSHYAALCRSCHRTLDASRDGVVRVWVGERGPEFAIGRIP